MYHVSDNFKRSVNSKGDAKNSVDLFLRGRQKISKGVGRQMEALRL